MGKTSYEGPVFGAKQLLWSITANQTAGSTALAAIVVPPGEDWLITHFHGYHGSTHSTATVLNLLDDSTTVGSLAFTSSLAGATGSTAVLKDAGEYIGQKVLSGSTLTIAIGGSSATASDGWQAWVYGYPRWRQDSSRGV